MATLNAFIILKHFTTASGVEECSVSSISKATEAADEWLTSRYHRFLGHFQFSVSTDSKLKDNRVLLEPKWALQSLL